MIPEGQGLAAILGLSVAATFGRNAIHLAGTTGHEGGAGASLRILPWWLPAGAALAVIAWMWSWFGSPPARWHMFFPLWLGCVLTLDGLVFRRAGSSLLSRSPRRFGVLFLFSVPLWWVFEGANRFLGNWRYVMPTPYGPITYALLASLAFSTVMPAILEMASLLRTTPQLGRRIGGPVLAPRRAGLLAVSALGAVMVALALLLPHHAFPLVWIGVFLVLDPINELFGWNSISAQVRNGRWDTVLTLWAAGLCCGILWELWNWRAAPKWVYEVPFVGRPTIFEMPLLGYGGYLPFALEVYAAYNLLHGLVFRRPDDGWLGIDEAPS